MPQVRARKVHFPHLLPDLVLIVAAFISFDASGQSIASGRPSTLVYAADQHLNADARMSFVNRPQVSIEYGKLPLVFESNQGQTDRKVKFISRGNGFSLFLATEEMVLALRTPRKADNSISLKSFSVSAPQESVVLRMKLLGAKRRPRVLGKGSMPGKVNYLVGKDPSAWRTNISTYAQVEYQDVYPRINLIYGGNHQALDYDFVVMPGGRPQSIGLQFNGAEKIEIESGGDLVLHIAGSRLRQPRPIAYQQIRGVRHEATANYVLTSANQVGFHLGNYDRRQPLVIDPTLAYSTYLGSSESTGGHGGIAVDSAGNAYVTGTTASAQFPTTSGAFQTTYGGSGDAFVSKLSPAGSDLVYSTYLGGSGIDYGGGIALDEAGNAYITGETSSPDFPVTSGAFQTHLRGARDAFVTKLNAAGSALVYSTYLDGSGWSFGTGVALDTAGNAYVTGATRSRDFPVTAGAFQTTYGGGLWDVFVSKLNPAGSSLLYSTYLGGDGGNQQAFGDVGWAIAVDTGGNAYVTGDGTPNFPTTPGAFQSTCRSAILNAFVTKLNPAGSALVYSTYLGGSSWDWGDAITVDAQGSAIVAGNANSSDFPTTSGVFQNHSGGNQDGFVTKFDPTGSALEYSTYLGGSSYEVIQGIILDAAGNAFLTGVTYSPDFPTTPGAFQTTFGGSGDAFITELNPQASAVLYSSFLGGSSLDWGYGIASDSAGGVYLTGLTSSSDFPTTPGAFRMNFNGSQETFITKLAFPLPDTTPPVITISATPRILWPPNGNMVPVVVAGTITDAQSGVNTNQVGFLVTDEYGQVHPKGTISLGTGGTYSFTVMLQASRLGSDLDGRHYTLTILASDNAGNVGSQTATVVVPHDRGN